jgi:hypothetical protein
MVEAVWRPSATASEPFCGRGRCQPAQPQRRWANSWLRARHTYRCTEVLLEVDHDQRRFEVCHVCVVKPDCASK